MALSVAGVLAAGPVAADATRDDAQELVNGATAVLESFRIDAAAYPQIARALQSGQAVLIMPDYVRVGVGLGGEGGHGVLLRKDRQSGAWGYPAFFRIKGGSIGPQLGYEEAKALFVIADEAMLQKLLNGEFQLGAEASALAGDSGASARVAASREEQGRMRLFMKRAGAFVGATLKGGVVEPADALNRAYYGSNATARGIVADRGFTNPSADPLRNVLAGMARRSSSRLE